MRKYIFLISIFIGFCILCALGLWQVQRLGEKEKLLHTIESGFLKAPVSWEIAMQSEEHDYQRVSLEGSVMPELFFLLQQKKGKLWGKDILQLLSVEDQVLLINWGWVEKEDQAEGVNKKGKVTLTGYLKPMSKPHFFRVKHHEGSRDLFWLEQNHIEQVSGQKVLPWVFYVTKTVSEKYPTPHQLKMDIPNNHKNYAIFWFSMAFILILMAWLVWRKDALYQHKK